MKKFAFAAVAAAALAGNAQAADLGSPRMPIAAAIVSPVFNWTGFYVGADLGYWTSNARTFNPILGPTIAASPKPNGLTLGGHLGYRYQFTNNVVLGAEADLSWLGGKTTTDVIIGGGGFQFFSLRATWDGSIRATAGYAIDRALLYVTGGLSFIDAKGCGVVPIVSNACLPGTSYRNMRMGWTLGAGIDYAISQNWTARGEYLYANYGTRTYATPNVLPRGLTSSRVETHKFRLGLNYLFSTGPSAVVARH
ncbi:MAG: outer membrane beta-barrel protein [Phreatobacter sp.]|nr:outer membrane beta-barrel protein [Phreatobacter sp.]